MMALSSLPSGGHNSAIKPFTIETAQEVLDELKTLVKYSKIAVPTYENSLGDRKYGIDRESLLSIKEKWINFDW
jgi:microsomal epoxide hydrolase